MTIKAVDIGFVAASDALVDFYREVLDPVVLEPRHFPFATVHRLDLGPVTLKVMVPNTPPGAPEPVAQFWDRSGLRYVTLWVEDVAALAERWGGAGGTVAMPPTELRPGVTTALLLDPDGNTVEAIQEATPAPGAGR